MDQNPLINDLVSHYRKHGWKFRRLLLRPETSRELPGHETLIEEVNIEEALVDALWFSRKSHGNREAWELRLVAETPYALFETFAADDPETLREEVRGDMVRRLIEYVSRPPVEDSSKRPPADLNHTK
jgi:hypothetical protein